MLIFVFVFVLHFFYIEMSNIVFLTLADIDIKLLSLFGIVWLLILVMVYAIYKLKKEK